MALPGSWGSPRIEGYGKRPDSCESGLKICVSGCSPYRGREGLNVEVSDTNP